MFPGPVREQSSPGSEPFHLFSVSQLSPRDRDIPVPSRSRMTSATRCEPLSHARRTAGRSVPHPECRPAQQRPVHPAPASKTSHPSAAVLPRAGRIIRMQAEYRSWTVPDKPPPVPAHCRDPKPIGRSSNPNLPGEAALHSWQKSVHQPGQDLQISRRPELGKTPDRVQLALLFRHLPGHAAPEFYVNVFQRNIPNRAVRQSLDQNRVSGIRVPHLQVPDRDIPGPRHGVAGSRPIGIGNQRQFPFQKGTLLIPDVGSLLRIPPFA